MFNLFYRSSLIEFELFSSANHFLFRSNAPHWRNTSYKITGAQEAIFKLFLFPNIGISTITSNNGMSSVSSQNPCLEKKDPQPVNITLTYSSHL